MKFTLDIEWSNDAPRTGAEVAKTLREAAKDIRILGPGLFCEGCGQNILDETGNSIGKWKIGDDVRPAAAAPASGTPRSTDIDAAYVSAAKIRAHGQERG
jgi:hypothetical protein